MSDPKPPASDSVLAAHERFRVTLASIGDAVIATDTAGRVTFINGVAEKLTGWTEAEAIGRSVGEVFRIVQEGTGKPADNPVPRVLRDGVTVGLANHTVLIARDGAEYPIDDSAAPIRDAGGAVGGVVLVFRDVTEKRAAELAALRLAAIVESSEDAIVGKDLSGMVTSWNPAAERLFGYTAEEMIGASITRIFPPDRLDEEQHILERLKAGERVDHFETIRLRKNGRPVPVSVTISPIRNRYGEIVGASKIARDLTLAQEAREQRIRYTQELEQRVRERTAELERTVGELEAFSYSLSHDLRAPVRSMHSFGEIVLADYGGLLPPDAVEMLRRIVGAASRMEHLIQDVLAFARVSREPIIVHPVDPGRIVRDIVQERGELRPPHAEVGVEEPLPRVVGHEASLTQCFTNLLDNAVKFVAPGVAPRVRVFGQEWDGRVRLCVQDNGIGVAEESRGRLFTMFQRLPTTHHYPGTGVGLAIVRKAAERMEGTVGLDSIPGQGSTFWVELPKA